LENNGCYFPSADLWLRALGHEFVRIARAIIHAAGKLEKLAAISTDN
jgi:hypothetical protein